MCTYLDRNLADHKEQGLSQLTSIALCWLDVAQGLWLLEVTIFERLRSLMRLGTQFPFSFLPIHTLNVLSIDHPPQQKRCSDPLHGANISTSLDALAQHGGGWNHSCYS